MGKNLLIQMISMMYINNLTIHHGNDQSLLKFISLKIRLGGENDLMELCLPDRH